MGVLLVVADFTGEYAIPQDSFSDLDSFITNNERDILIDLLGAELEAAFEADLTAKVPNSDKYKNIFNAFSKDYGDAICVSKGMKKMLLGFLFFDFMRKIKYKATSSGVVINSPDAGVQESPGYLYGYYNDAVNTYKAIQNYIVNIKYADYQDGPTFNGQEKDFAISLFL